MTIKNNVSLKSFNTFGLEAYASLYAGLTDIGQINVLRSTGEFQNNKLLVLGGGSNVLFTDDFNGLVLRIMLKGISVVKESNDHVFIKAMAGENWETFVEYCVEQGWGGLENLTLIPGNVGTSPMQNIGAYGVELKDVFYELEAIEISNGKSHVFSIKDCQFGYRDSFFKQQGKGRFIITSVTFQLTKNLHLIRSQYGPVKQELETRGIQNPGIKDIMDVIQSIRRSKLPDPTVLGNAGSFFKNPVLSKDVFAELVKNWPGLPSYEDASGNVKTAAAWLIEKAGWKGYREGDAGVHQNQALVLVNYGNATGKQIIDLAGKIQSSVMEKFGVFLEMEVNIIDNS
jgi:UDP-N-acetylmuramate dehydrogenase